MTISFSFLFSCAVEAVLLRLGISFIIFNPLLLYFSCCPAVMSDSWQPAKAWTVACQAPLSVGFSR